MELRKWCVKHIWPIPISKCMLNVILFILNARICLNLSTVISLKEKFTQKWKKNHNDWILIFGWTVTFKEIESMLPLIVRHVWTSCRILLCVIQNTPTPSRTYRCCQSIWRTGWTLLFIQSNHMPLCHCLLHVHTKTVNK